MSEIKEGEYIRTSQGFISKVEYIEEDMIMCESVIYSEYEFDDVLVDEQMKLVTKHSFNILDLIEVGDYVNGYKVDSIENGKLIIGDTTQVVEQILDDNEDIKTILTHEQFEQNSYKVVE